MSILTDYTKKSPGSTVGNCTKEQSIQHIADCINRALKETSNVTCVIENMVRVYYFFF